MKPQFSSCHVAYFFFSSLSEVLSQGNKNSRKENEENK